jgi:hypothetical protein
VRLCKFQRAYLYVSSARYKGARVEELEFFFFIFFPHGVALLSVVCVDGTPLACMQTHAPSPVGMVRHATETAMLELLAMVVIVRWRHSAILMHVCVVASDVGWWGLHCAMHWACTRKASATWPFPHSSATTRVVAIAWRGIGVAFHCVSLVDTGTVATLCLGMPVCWCRGAAPALADRLSLRS